MLLLLAAQLVRGFCVGSADVVPGVSGGTIALVLGIYERLVATIRQGAAALGYAVRLDIRTAFRRFLQVDWYFLIPLLIGVVSAVLILARPIQYLLEEHPVGMAAAFFGLVVASVAIVWDGLRTRDSRRLGVMIAVALATFWVLGWRSAEASDPTLWFVFVAGLLAICAMILPGISGSVILLMLGMYDYIIGAVNDRDLLVLGVFLVGCVIGLASFSSLIHSLLRRYGDTMLAALIGLMAGSLRVLWPWPEGVETAELGMPAAGDMLVPAALAVGAAVVVTVLHRLSQRMPRR